ncbi:hypothetical protein CAPTEDRAFT_17752 [Capitella teleta]|uniref:Ubiquitin-conjugating enzyme E2 J2 n=1 Tax=Capitella teleta TaxID=283909 RepID=R7V2C0_CAPTE|nr:hypothetical protein CAPTEDRAFT_17752 [Capitella teleta]|eukprot:ELU12627.1 hypothetical protein CAPTEDRAFT_17752 [Capitella teleta]
MSRKRTDNTAYARLRQDYLRLKRDPVPYITAEPLPANILEWHYVVRGPEKSPYEGGYYHGKLMFPREFPFKPPSIYIITPNGRFKVNTRLCLSISDFHPDTWNPAWSVATILTGLLSFMLEKAPTLGSVETSDYTKRQLAVNSGPFNLKDQVFCELFPDVVKDIEMQLKAQEEELRKSSLASTSLVGSRASGLQGPVVGGGGQGMLSSTLTNLFVIVGFAAFAYTVKYVLRSIVD